MNEVMCELINPYKCPKCNQDVLFFVTSSNTLIDYMQLFKKGMSKDQIREYLAEKRVRYIKCIKCNTVHIIDWSKGYPVPLLKRSDLKKFGV